MAPKQLDQKHHKANRRFYISLAVLVLGFIVVIFFLIKPVSQADIARVCDDSFAELTSDIQAIPGFTIVNSSKSCTPQSGPDEAGNIDYDFSAQFSISKQGNDTERGIRKNMELLKNSLPQKDYTISIQNDYAAGGRPNIICVNATTLVQAEYGEIYNSYAVKEVDFKTPGTADGTQPCNGAL